MGDKPVAFLGAHGVIVTGETVHQAFDDLYYLERACQAQIIAMSTGRQFRPLPEKLVVHVASQMQTEAATAQARWHLEAVKRLLDRDAPGWRGD
jgi:ribulose-5-phosphate 4-epimerase/fuculose-1-phosphate aldolase